MYACKYKCVYIYKYMHGIYVQGVCIPLYTDIYCIYGGGSTATISKR